MKKVVYICCLTLIALAGCEKKVDPKSRPGFVDTTDPGKVGSTMATTPKGPGPNAPKAGGKSP